MLDQRAMEWGGVRATVIARGRVGPLEQRFRLPWHAFRLGLSGRFDRGSTQRLDGGRPSALTGLPGRAAFYPAGTDIANAVAGASRLTYLMVEIDRDAPGGAAAPPPVVDLVDPLCLALLEALGRSVDHPTGADRLFAESIAMTLLLAVARAAGDGRGRGRAAPLGGLAPARLARVTDYLAAHLAEPVGLAELAALADLSPSHFCRAFRRSTGLTPHRWQMRARVERAKALLHEGDLPLAAVAAAAGFADQSHLTTVFRRLAGLPPGAWRRRERG